MQSKNPAETYYYVSKNLDFWHNASFFSLGWSLSLLVKNYLIMDEYHDAFDLIASVAALVAAMIAYRLSIKTSKARTALIQQYIKNHQHGVNENENGNGN